MEEQPDEKLLVLVNRLKQEKYPDADSLLLAGSVIRGEATSTSDLDIIVLYPELPNAYRDSYYYDNWPVEAFVHDLQTLTYFIDEIDAPTGVPSLATMVDDGKSVPSATELSKSAKVLAQASLRKGPEPWSIQTVNSARYMITDLIEDLKDSRNATESQAIASVLYSTIVDFYFRIHGFWSAKGKTIPRRLRKVDPGFAERFEKAFSAVFLKNESQALISLVSDLLAPHGGPLFSGHRLEAPEEWRK